MQLGGLVFAGMFAPWAVTQVGWKVPDQAQLAGGLVGATLLIVAQVMKTPAKIDKERQEQIDSLQSEWDSGLFEQVKSLFESRIRVLDDMGGQPWKPKRSPWGMEHAFFHENQKIADDARNFVNINLKQMQNEFDPEEVYLIRRKGGFNAESIRGTSYESLLLEKQQLQTSEHRSSSEC